VPILARGLPEELVLLGRRQHGFFGLWHLAPLVPTGAKPFAAAGAGRYCDNERRNLIFQAGRVESRL
jgi:hypothetical protein